VTSPLTTHKRKPLTTRERIELFRAHNGVCCICGGKINVGETWWDEHERALALGGTNDADNRGPAHEICARAKTKKDMQMIAKAKRLEAKHFGAKSARKGAPIPGSKASGWKRKLDGTTERRT